MTVGTGTSMGVRVCDLLFETSEQSKRVPSHAFFSRNGCPLLVSPYETVITSPTMLHRSLSQGHGFKGAHISVLAKIYSSVLDIFIQEFYIYKVTHRNFWKSEPNNGEATPNTEKWNRCSVGLRFPLVICQFRCQRDNLGETLLVVKFALDAELGIEVWRRPAASPTYWSCLSLKDGDTPDSRAPSRGPGSSLGVRQVFVFP